MVDPNVGEERLETFDSLDLNQKEERRLQVLTLWDFYSETIVEVGTGYLGLKKDTKEGNLTEQWKRARNRLIQLPDFESEGEYEKAIQDLNKIRNNTFHDYEHWPTKERLNGIRSSAPDFRNWLIENSETYDEEINELDVQDIMIRMAERNLEDIINAEPAHEPFKSEIEQRSKEASTLQSELDGLKSEDGVSVDLVNILLSSMELAEETSEIMVSEGHVDYVLAEIGEPEVDPSEFGL